MNIKVFGVGVDVGWIISILLQALGKIVDGVIDGGKLSADQVKGVRTYFFLANEWGDDLVKNTENDLDDQALSFTLSQCVDLAEEGKFPLPEYDA